MGFQFLETLMLDAASILEKGPAVLDVGSTLCGLLVLVLNDVNGPGREGSNSSQQRVMLAKIQASTFKQTSLIISKVHLGSNPPTQ